MRDIFRRLPPFALLCAATLLSASCGDDSAAGEHAGSTIKAAEPSPTRAHNNNEIQVHLTRVKIPHGSPIIDRRGRIPDLRVDLYEDGVEIAKSSRRWGLAVEFPRTDSNIWTLRPGASYSLQVIDHTYVGRNRILFQKTGLSIEDLVAGKPIFEDRGPLTPIDQCASIEFTLLR